MCVAIKPEKSSSGLCSVY